MSHKIRHPSGYETRALAQKLLTALIDAPPGWALSAPQLGVPQKMFVMATPRIFGRVGPEAREVRLPTMGDRWQPKGFDKSLHFTAVVNPVVRAVSRETEADRESCLSVPGVCALVPRHVWIDVEFTTLDNTVYQLRLEDHPARVFQHEFDHLEGIMFTDRILDTGDLIMEAELDRQFLEQRKERASSEPTRLDETFTLYV